MPMGMMGLDDPLDPYARQLMLQQLRQPVSGVSQLGQSGAASGMGGMPGPAPPVPRPMPLPSPSQGAASGFAQGSNAFDALSGGARGPQYAQMQAELARPSMGQHPFIAEGPGTLSVPGATPGSWTPYIPVPGDKQYGGWQMPQPGQPGSGAPTVLPPPAPPYGLSVSTTPSAGATPSSILPRMSDPTPFPPGPSEPGSVLGRISERRAAGQGMESTLPQADPGGIAGGVATGGIAGPATAPSVPGTPPPPATTAPSATSGGKVATTAPLGYDQTKWNDPTHTTIKYVAGRILSKYGPLGKHNMPQAWAEIKAAFPKATWDGGDGIDFGDGFGPIDVVNSFDTGQGHPQWLVVNQQGKGGKGGTGGSTDQRDARGSDSLSGVPSPMLGGDPIAAIQQLLNDKTRQEMLRQLMSLIPGGGKK